MKTNTLALKYIFKFSGICCTLKSPSFRITSPPLHWSVRVLTSYDTKLILSLPAVELICPCIYCDVTCLAEAPDFRDKHHPTKKKIDFCCLSLCVVRKQWGMGGTLPTSLSWE